MSNCNGEKIMLYHEWRRKQENGRDDYYYWDAYAKYYHKATKACRDKQRKAKRGY